jgi:1,2-diacylglycerol 3-beta-glucosyltransferase
VSFAPDAVVWAEMPDSLGAAQSQNERWEKGRMEMIQRFVPRLLGEALRRRSFLLFDAAVEQLIPPFSVLAGLSVLFALGAVLLPGFVTLALAGIIILGQIIYVFSGLVLARAPRAIYLALLFAPVFVLWKLWLYVRLLLGLKPKNWVRTARNDS